MKRGLGKGLDALFTDNATEGQNEGVISLRISEIEPNKTQPRKDFGEEALSQLADSIRQHGVLQPLTVRPIPGSGNYQLVAGERRWRASRMAGLTEVPVIIREMSDHEAMEIALIENLQREDLNPIEEARGFQTLMDTYQMTQDEIAKRVGKSRPAVTNALRLLNLPVKLLEMVRQGDLSQGQARTLLSIGDENRMQEAAEEVVSRGLSVREVEKLVKQAEKAQADPPEKGTEPKKESMITGEVERNLSEWLGRKVKITQGKKKGCIEIEYYDEEDLKHLSMQLSGGIHADC